MEEDVDFLMAWSLSTVAIRVVLSGGNKANTFFDVSLDFATDHGAFISLFAIIVVYDSLFIFRNQLLQKRLDFAV